MVGHWDRGWAAWDKYKEPHGFHHLTDFLGGIIGEADVEKQRAMLRSEDSFNLWQSIIRGAGAVTGCRRCQDVCPVGADYEKLLMDAVDEIAEDTKEKRGRLADMTAAEDKGTLPDSFAEQARWIGRRAGE